MSDVSAELFHAVIDDHRRRPRNRGPLPGAHRVVRRENPACGDLCTLQLRFDPAPPLAPDTRIAGAAFTGAGCALSQASASLATVALDGRRTAEARALIDQVEKLVGSDAAPPSTEPGSFPAADIGDLAALGAARAFPARHACALLVWQAAREALSETAAPSP